MSQYQEYNLHKLDFQGLLLMEYKVAKEVQTEIRISSLIQML